MFCVSKMTGETIIVHVFISLKKSPSRRTVWVNSGWVFFIELLHRFSSNSDISVYVFSCLNWTFSLWDRCITACRRFRAAVYRKKRWRNRKFSFFPGKVVSLNTTSGMAETVGETNHETGKLELYLLISAPGINLWDIFVCFKHLAWLSLMKNATITAWYKPRAACLWFLRSFAVTDSLTSNVLFLVCGVDVGLA